MFAGGGDDVIDLPGRQLVSAISARFFTDFTKHLWLGRKGDEFLAEILGLFRVCKVWRANVYLCFFITSPAEIMEILETSQVLS